MSWSTSKLRVRLARHGTGLSPPVKYIHWPFQGCASFVDHLCYFCLVCVMLLCTSIYWCLVVTCWGKGFSLGSRLWCLIMKLSLFHWYPGSGVVLDYIDSWSLPSFLLCTNSVLYLVYSFYWKLVAWRWCFSFDDWDKPIELPIFRVLPKHVNY